MHSKTSLSKRFPAVLAVAAAGLLALPASGMAAETFGSRLLNGPTTGACGVLVAPCTYVSFIHPSDPDGDPYSGGAPSDGVITKFRIRAYGTGGIDSPASVTFRLANINRSNPDSAQAASVATGPTVTVAGTGEIEEFPGRVPVKKGNHLAIDTSDANAIYASSGEKFTYVYTPPLVDGAAARTSDEVIDELLVAAVIEPDADRDGYGDESQDSCPASPAAHEGACPTDRVKPRLISLSVAPKAFESGAKVRYRLSEAAKVTLKVEKAKRGRKVSGKCRKPTAANRLRKACTRWTGLGSLKRNGAKGLNETALPAKVGGRRLGPGRYRVVATAEDAAGNVSTVKRARFRVKR